MAELWREMEQRGDGILSWSQRTDLVDVGRPLSARADRYLAERPRDMEAVRALFTLRLAHVPVLGEPVRRRALRSECAEEQWRIVETLSDHDWRLLTVSEDVATHEPTVEVAHEQLLRSWTTLRDWLAESRDFFAWMGALEQARLGWLAADKTEDALLMGVHLRRAQYWRNERGRELRPDDRSFIEVSEHREARAAQKESDDKEHALATQSRYMAQAAQNELERGDYGTGLALAIEALPRDVVTRDRPYVVEAERALQAVIRHNTKELAVLRGHEGPVRSAVFSADGARVLTASEDRTARLWEAATGKDFAVLRGHEGRVVSALFSPDGARVLPA